MQVEVLTHREQNECFQVEVLTHREQNERFLPAPPLHCPAKHGVERISADVKGLDRFTDISNSSGENEAGAVPDFRWRRCGLGATLPLDTTPVSGYHDPCVKKLCVRPNGCGFWPRGRVTCYADLGHEASVPSLTRPVGLSSVPAQIDNHLYVHPGCHGTSMGFTR